MRTTIRMNQELARRAKAYAARRKRTFTQVVEEALTELLAGDGKETPSERIVLPTAGDPNARPMSAEEVQRVIDGTYEEEAVRIASMARGDDGHPRR